MKWAMRFSVLASGSSGNACYVESADTRILIDAGLSARETERRLEQAGIKPESLTAIIITHEHQDHIKGAGVLTRRYHLPLYINQDTLENGKKVLGKIFRPMIIRTGEALNINDLVIETFTKCHDAADPMGVIVSVDGIRMGIATDMGRSTRLVEDRLRGCRALILEFNHDTVMLDEGPYPIYLKQRIKGRDGHLSNDQAGDLLETVCDNGLGHLVLAHLSEINNNPDIAYQKACDVLNCCGLKRTNITVSSQDEVVPMIELT
ncbi:Metallo-beta-lactamase domain protein [uncultured Desulfobacterium sp.]|uniref:Metallo-beta-lactamase domain protein n=1 Tax=uncultured Desulfobacterium sp. TaxID=201089 RepID=A0A445MZS1_9BACT|nr:Metallo-beta-lactamase domain protein [uncultured Desulfobacterium sp.]